MIGIYSITNKLNNKRYIGQSIDIETRIKRHFRELRRGVHHCHHLQRAFDKYGEDNFETEILLICNENDDLNEKENYWDSEITQLSTELNTITTEIDSVKKLREDAISSTFKWGSA